MKFDQIQAFVNVVELQSFHKAAKALNLSTSAISKKITLLETEGNLILMHRTTRGFTLSAAGQLFYTQCCDIISQVNKAEATLKAVHSEPHGTLSIHGTLLLSKIMILPYLGEFLKLYPKIRLRLHLSDRIPDFEREDVDIFWGIMLKGPDFTKNNHFGSSRHVLVASPTYLEKHGTPEKPSDLSKHIYIDHQLHEQHMDELIFKKYAPVKVVPTVVVNNSIAMQILVNQGVGIANLMYYEVHEALATGQLIEVCKDYPQETYPLYLYYRETAISDARIRCFIDFILEKNKNFLEILSQD